MSKSNATIITEKVHTLILLLAYKLATDFFPCLIVNISQKIRFISVLFFNKYYVLCKKISAVHFCITENKFSF